MPKRILHANLRFYRILFSKHKLALLFCAFLFACSIALGYWYYVRSSLYRGVINRTLQVDLESTPQQYKGLEAFILSYVDQSVPQILARQSIDSSFEKAYGDFLNSIAQAGDEIARHPVTEVSLSSEGGKTTIEHFAFIEGQTVQDSVHGIPFVPAELLHAKSPLYLGQAAEATQSGKHNVSIRSASSGTRRDPNHALGSALVVDDEVVPNELYLASKISSSLQYLTAQHIYKEDRGHSELHALNPKPVQAFFITYTGVNRTFTDPENIRPNRFPRTTFFPSRPYFWPPFQQGKVTRMTQVSGHYQPLSSSTSLANDGEAKTTSTLGDLFFVSRPYLDMEEAAWL